MKDERKLCVRFWVDRVHACLDGKNLLEKVGFSKSKFSFNEGSSLSSNKSILYMCAPEYFVPHTLNIYGFAFLSLLYFFAYLLSRFDFLVCFVHSFKG